MSKCRAFVFTINNYTDEVVEALHSYECRYLVYGKEVGESGTPHLQGYVEHKDALTYSAFNKKLGLKKGGPFASCKKREGTPKQAAGYCKKGKEELQTRDGTSSYCQFYENPSKTWDGFERGTISEQGQRTDIQEVINDIMEGNTIPDEICVNDAMFYHQYGRTCNKAFDILKRKQFRNWMTEGIWYHGPTYAGKSHQAFEGYSPDTHYIWSNYERLQTYKGQEIIIINELRRHDISYSFLLQLIDKWPMYIPYKGEEPYPLLAKKVIITSSLPPTKIFDSLDKDDNINQLLRRINVIELAQRSVEQSSPSPVALTSDEIP